GVHLRPVPLPGRLEVVNLRRNLGFAADADRLVDGLQQPLAFATHVRDVLPLVLRRDLAQFDQLLGVSVIGGGVFQRRRDAERFIAHLAFDQLLHLLYLVGVWLLVFQAEHVFTRGRRAKKRRNVVGHAFPFQEIEIVAERVPFD